VITIGWIDGKVSVERRRERDSDELLEGLEDGDQTSAKWHDEKG